MTNLLGQEGSPHIMTKFSFPARRFFAITASLLLACVSLQAQTIILSFSGVNLADADALGTGSTPPDTMGAAGPNQFAEFINGAFAVYSKSGARQKLITDSNFWQNAGISPSTQAAGLTDTRIIYDPPSGRWFASEITLDLTGAQVLLGRSDTSDPAGPWKAVHFNSNTDSRSPDFDTLGVDSTGVYVGVNDFDLSGNFTGVSFFSIPKADLLASPPSLANVTRFDNLDDALYGFSPQGVTNPDPGPGHGVMMAIESNFYNQFHRTTIFGSGGPGATLGPPATIDNTYDADPVPARQPAGGIIDTGDDRFSAIIRQVGGYIFLANNISNTTIVGGRNAVHWMVLNEVDNTLVGEGLIGDSTYDYFYPSIAANHSGKILLAFNRSGATSPDGDISVYAAVGSINGSTVTMGSPFLVRPGSINNYHLNFDSPPYRWGDYSTTMVDPIDDNLFWTIQEIPPTSTTWGTQITLISVATNAPSLTITPFGANLDLSWPLSSDPAYVLQAAPTVPSATWTNVPSPVVIQLSKNVVTVPAPATAMFYRLKN
jgi:hypothetical protein